ncbi:ankyrin repeat-containing protein [Prunus yedoensis var. nudiflora]|uniref:Ankyrin repeat-containing protein n=1 Tax=Prunus yedoensis var. nudiflora TaxID=2094558 RepID=A0A314YB70_PRUYE|nr:ankyrin repeat-containing protein [Prunus yedoensis var. nudiflora]
MDRLVYEAATSGDVDLLKKIEDGDESPDVLYKKTPKDNNVLHIAAEFKQINFFNDIPLEYGSSLFWATNKKGNTPLHVAARVGCHEVVKFLIEHAQRMLIDPADQESGPADANAHKELLRKTNSQKDTALHVAVRNGHVGVVTLLVEADPQLCSFTNSANESPLFLAVRNGSANIVLYILNESPVIPSFHGTNGVTALHMAVTRKHLTGKGIVETMVSKNHGIIREVDELGWTPLHYAALGGNLEATKVLLRLDSDTSYILDKSGLSALHVAAYAGCTKIMEEMIGCRPDTFDLLNDKGQTILHAAVLGEQINAVNYILKNPKLAGLINEVDDDGNTPLHLAARQHNRPIIRTLTDDRRVDKTAINEEFSQAADFFLGDNFGEQTIHNRLPKLPS